MFVRRFTEIPTVEVIRQIEGVVIIDLAPPDPVTGAGSGAVLLVGEFEDGYFATDAAAKGSVEVYGSSDYAKKFGGFGYTYGLTPSQNPSARRHMMELWNGNGYLKGFKLKAQRLMVARVDTSVGQVAFDPKVSIQSTATAAASASGPWPLPVGGQISATTNTGGPAVSTALAAVVATKAGAAATFGTIASGDSFGIRIDGGPMVTVVFGGADTTQAAVISRINATLGFTCAIANLTQVDLRALLQGTSGTLELIETTTGVLAKIGHTAGIANGTGNVGNINAVTAAELVTIVNATAALGAINVKADVGPTGTFRLLHSVSAAASTLLVTSTPMSVALGLAAGVAKSLANNPAGTINAGTRVRASGTPGVEWVTMQTLDIPAGSVGPFTVKVRPAFDDGTAAGIGATLVNTMVDPSNVGPMSVNNAQALTAALNEVQMDNAYIAALTATLNADGAAREANYLLSARRSDTIVREGRANVIKATECGLFARKFITGDALGATIAQGVANVAQFRSDRVFYTTKGLKVRIPGIAQLGLSGGLGFTADGVISVRPDGPLTTICATRPPEENPGQQTNLIDDFFEVDGFGETLPVEAYIAYKAAGIACPLVDRDVGTVFESGVTSSLESGRTTMARRKMADFIQDTATKVFKPYVKRLNRQSMRDKARGVWEQFLGELKSEGNPEVSRIENFSVDDSANAGNTPTNLALGMYWLKTKVRTLSSMDDIVVQTEIGENAVISTDSTV